MESSKISEKISTKELNNRKETKSKTRRLSSILEANITMMLTS